MKQANKLRITALVAAVLASILVAFVVPAAYAQTTTSETVPVVANVTQVAALVGVIMGSITRSVFMFYAKKQADPDITFSGKYTATLGFAIVAGAVTAVLGMGGFAIPDNPSTLLGLFYMAFFYGWGLQDVANELVKRVSGTTATVATKTTTTASTDTSSG